MERKHHKALNFDLNKKALVETGFSGVFPFALKPYRLIRKELETLGFEHRQYSGYQSVKPMSTQDVVVMAQKLGRRLPWLKGCMLRFDASNLPQEFDIMGHIIKGADKELEKTHKIERQKSVPERATPHRAEPDKSAQSKPEQQKTAEAKPHSMIKLSGLGNIRRKEADVPQRDKKPPSRDERADEER